MNQPTNPPVDPIAQFMPGDEPTEMRPDFTEAELSEFVPPKRDAINPDHYQDYMVIGGDLDFAIKLQWMEAQQYKPYWRKNPQAFVQAVLLQSDKYISRLGQKDDETQEMQKSLWYLKFATAFMKNGLKPIWVKDIDAILDPKLSLALRFTRAVSLEDQQLLNAGFTEEDVKLYNKMKVA